MKRAVILAIALVVVATGCTGATRPVEPARRLLIVSIPGVGWSDVDRLGLEHISEVTERGAIGHLATRVGRQSAEIGAAYLTIGAGTRAVAPEVSGVALEPDEVFLGHDGRSVVRRRVGTASDGIAYVDVGVAAADNESSSFGAVVGAVGDALAGAGIPRAVIANGDLGIDPDEPSEYGRDAVAALMTSDGVVPGGSVSADLLEADASAPWGVRLDAARVVEEFDRAWSRSDRAAVLVEASDVRRAATYATFVTPRQERHMRDAALRDADRMLGSLLDRVGDDDAVMVVSPVRPSGANDLGLVALRAPGVHRGLLRSATTRRTGYVQLADVGPTVASIVGVDVPEPTEGRRFTAVEKGERDRVGDLVLAADEARFRDRSMVPVVLAFIAALALLTAGASAVRLVPSWATPLRLRLLRGGALVALAAVPATFLAHAFSVPSRSLAALAAAVLTIAAVIAGAALALERSRRGAALVAVLGVLVAVIVGDVLFGAPLQVNAIFGYSVSVAGRFAGLGNLAFSLLGVSAILLAVLVDELDTARARALAIALLVGVVFVEGLPMFGADVGGILSMVPAFGLTAVALRGHRVRRAHVVAVAAIAVGFVFAMAFVDLARAADSRTHLARLAENLTDGRWDRLADTVFRRWSASFGGGELGAWVALALVAGLTAAYVVRLAIRGRRRGAAGNEMKARSARAAATGVGVLAMLGLVANDSSFAVPAIMLLVVVPVLVERSTRTEPFEAMA